MRKILKRNEEIREVIHKSKNIAYFKCPLCGMQKPFMYRYADGVRKEVLKPHEAFELGYDKNDFVIVIRKGGGRGVGFYSIEGYTLEEVYRISRDFFERLFKAVEDLYIYMRRIERESRGGH